MRLKYFYNVLKIECVYGACQQDLIIGVWNFKKSEPTYVFSWPIYVF